MKLYDRSWYALKKEPWYKIKDTDGVINFIGQVKPLLHFEKMKLREY